MHATHKNLKRQVAPGVWRIPVLPGGLINCYLLGDVLVDAGLRSSAARILAALEGSPVSAHALTHAHPDHQGSSRQICETLRLPYWVGKGDRAAAGSGEMRGQYRNPDGWIARLQSNRYAGPGLAVDRVLTEGDRVGEFEVLETPGHTRGHVAFWRRHDRLLVLGDVALSMNPFTGLRGLRLPPGLATPDPGRNRASLRKLAVLGPEVVCFGHGLPLRDPERFQAFVQRVAGGRCR